jgi:hypothetical protein
MGLTANNLTSGNPGRVFGLAQGAFAPGLFSHIANAVSFGQKTTVPQGMNKQYALRMSVQVGGNIAAKMRADLDLSASIQGAGQLAARMEAETFWVAQANVAMNGYATFAAEVDMIAALAAIGGMSANMDLLARPSAADIAQEVWNAARSGYQSPGSMGRVLSDSEKAAKLGAALSA